ncbi:MAG: putative selenate reductase subunit YgfK, partial [Clostridia bacterium]|nr:putative selenate reductase subunit YgfK [Clostridia bacterium]
VPMFRRLLAKAAENGVTFGLKLSNTFPVDVTRNELPSTEMYMSGRSLYPLTIEMAKRISAEFAGTLRLSFSGGIDVNNIVQLFKSGIWPITLATTILKPGGYQRLEQMGRKLLKAEYKEFDGVSVGKVEYLANRSKSDSRNTKAIKPLPNRKLPSKVPLTTCFTAPCTHGCPIHQDIPEYVELVGKGLYKEALELILQKNPLPFMTGTICSHHCMDKCTRNFYEESVHIRDAKLVAAKNGFESVIKELKPAVPQSKDVKVAVIGGGPAGMAAAYFLGREGASVTLFERRERLGGIVRYIIPPFRIPDESIDKDAEIIRAMGVEIRTGTEAPDLKELKANGYNAVVYATGAWKRGDLRLESGTAINVLDFLEQFKNGTLPPLGEDIAIIGGGNTAMDAARTALRIPGVRHVRLVYRRTRRYMPADEEELALALEEGVEFSELLAPKSLLNGMLVCDEMRLGDPDQSGRRSPVKTGKTIELPCSALISATGNLVDDDYFRAQDVSLTAKGRVAVDDLLQTSQDSVFVIGDANRGPATIVEAIADARTVADAIIGQYAYRIPADAEPTAEACLAKQGVLRPFDSGYKENERCLACSAVCECCVQVCPNRANIALDVKGLRMPQIIHIDRMCNECGNCYIFCPYDSRPYKEKLTLFSTEAEFDESGNPGFYYLSGKKFKLRTDGAVRQIDLDQVTDIDPDIEKILFTVLEDYPYLLA